MPPKLKVYQLESNTICSPYRLIYPGDALNRSADIEVKLFRDFGQRQCDAERGGTDGGECDGDGGDAAEHGSEYGIRDGAASHGKGRGE